MKFEFEANPEDVRDFISRMVASGVDYINSIAQQLDQALPQYPEGTVARFTYKTNPEAGNSFYLLMAMSSGDWVGLNAITGYGPIHMDKEDVSSYIIEPVGHYSVAKWRAEIASKELDNGKA